MITATPATGRPRPVATPTDHAGPLEGRRATVVPIRTVTTASSARRSRPVARPVDALEWRGTDGSVRADRRESEDGPSGPTGQICHRRTIYTLGYAPNGYDAPDGHRPRRYDPPADTCDGCGSRHRSDRRGTIAPHPHHHRFCDRIAPDQYRASRPPSAGATTTRRPKTRTMEPTPETQTRRTAPRPRDRAATSRRYRANRLHGPEPGVST